MGYFQERVSLFKIQGFRWYALSAFLAMVGNGVSYIALMWMVMAAHDSVTSVMMIMFCLWLPNVFLGPFAGVLVDRYSKRACLLYSTCLRGLLLIVFGLASMVHFNVIALYVMALLQGVLFSLALPTVIALVRELVPDKALMSANATIDMAYELGNVVGMAMAGFMIAWLTAKGVLVFDGAMFLVAGIAAYKMVVTRPTPVVARSLSPRLIWNDLTAGLRYMTSAWGLVVIYMTQLFLMVAFMSAPVLGAPFAKHILHANVTHYGYLSLAMSAGVLLGGMVAPWIGARFGVVNSLMGFMAMLMLGFTCFTFIRSYPEILMINIGLGIALAAWPLAMTEAMHQTNVAYQGRVQASFNSLTGVFILGVYAFMGVGSHMVTVPHLYFIEVALMGAGFVMLLVYRWMTARVLTVGSA